MKFLLLLLSSLLACAVQAQTITPDESQVIVPSPKKIGINLNGPTYYQGGEIYKNLLWRNPGFEPDLYRDKFVAFKAGTKTSFPSPNYYDPVPKNFWKGATFRLYRGLPRQTVCSGTLAGNSVADADTGPVYRFASPCSTAVQEGDVILLRKMDACTTEASWEHQGAGWWGSVDGGGRLLSECNAPYDGVQSLRMDATANGSTATLNGYVDTNPTDVGILISGQYTISGYYRTEGDAMLSVGARRIVDSSAGSPLACETQVLGTAASWTPFTVVCNGYETKQVQFGPIAVTLTAENGVVELDDVAFQKSAGTDPTNTTVFRDELLATLRAHCAGASLTAIPCELRDWAFQNADEIDNTIKPLFQRSPTLPGTNYDVPPNGGTGSNSVSLEEFLQLCAAIGAEPYYALPETTGPEDAARWVEYLNGDATTTYGAKRVANGHAESWLKTFPTTHLAMGNENWNEGATGQGLGYRPGAPDYYYDYSVDTAGVWTAMRNSAPWPSNGAGIDLVLGLQNGNPDYGVTEAMTRTNADSAELAPYTQLYVGDVSPLTSLWNPLFYEVVANTTNPATTFFQQSAAVRKHGKVNVYEFDNSTYQGSSELTQAVLDSFTDAAGYGTATALQALQHLSAGIIDQNFFSLDQYAFSIPDIGYVHNWGAVIDMGGATNAVRPQELGMRMANAAIIGPMYACPVANATTFDLSANHNGQDSNGTPAANGIPQQYAYCFMAGQQRSMVVINTDVVAAHAIGFAGAQAPSGIVTVTRYAPASISDRNEAGANDATKNAPQPVTISDPFSVTDPVSDTLPPYSITRFDWTVLSPPPTPVPTTTTLTVSPTRSVRGAPIVLTAVTSPSTATGTVSFQDGTESVGLAELAGGSASLTLVDLPAGVHTFTATYGGDAGDLGSTSVASTVTTRPALAVPLKASRVTSGVSRAAASELR